MAAYPGVRAGRGRPPKASVEGWLQAAWLMLAEGRAYVEDIEGGTAQPQMAKVAKLLLLEQLADVDNRLAGRTPVPSAHLLALALEYGLSELADVGGEELAETFRLPEEMGDAGCETDDVRALWHCLLEGFPGELPDRLLAQGQRDLLLAFQGWARLARAAGLDVGLLAPLIKEA